VASSLASFAGGAEDPRKKRLEADLIAILALDFPAAEYAHVIGR
jgi:hypothetical protein